MTKKMPIALFVEQLYAAYKRKDGYIMGATGQNPKKWAVNSWWFNQYKDHPKQYKQALYWREHADRVWDCNGLAEGLYKDYTGTDINTKARYNYAQWCAPKGKGLIPASYRVPGAAVFWSDEPKKKPSASNIHHVAYLYKPVVANKPDGDWYIIEARGVMYGVVMTKLYDRKPNLWGWMTKYYDYDQPAVTTPVTPYDSTLRRGCKGDDVKELQRDLMKLGYKLPKYGADGDFGSETEKAVKAFQTDHHLTADGVMHSDDYTMLFAALDGQHIEPGPEPPTPAPTVQHVEITGGTVNVRSGPGTSGTRILAVAHKGDRYPYQGKTQSVGGRDWYLIEYEGVNAWVSSRFAKVV